MACNYHGGYGFKSDCWICKAKQTLKDNEGAIERRDKVIATQAAAIAELESKLDRVFIVQEKRMSECICERRAKGGDMCPGVAKQAVRVTTQAATIEALEAENAKLREALETIRDSGLEPIDEAYRRLAATALEVDDE